MWSIPITSPWTSAVDVPPVCSRPPLLSVLVGMLVLLSTQPSLPAVQTPTDNDDKPNWIRGSAEKLELQLSGKISRSDGGSTENAQVEISINYNDRRFEVLKPQVEHGEFQTWLPVNKYRWYSIIVQATCPDGARCTKTILRQQTREFVVRGLELQVRRPNRQIEVQLEHHGKAVANATVRAKLDDGTLLRAKSDANGLARFEMIDDEKLSRLSAWSEQRLIGGYQFSRKPIRDPQADSHVISMSKCRQFEVQVKDQNDQPVAGVELAISVATPPPEYNFFGLPDNFKLVTNPQGSAMFPWYPDIKNAHCNVEILDEGWEIASREKDEERLRVVGKTAIKRQTMTGNLSGGGKFAGGFSIKLGTFQDEQEGRIDFVYRFTDPNGNFTAEVLPDATYAVFLEDDKWVSDAVDLVPYQSDTQRRNSPALLLSEGIPVRIQLTQGIDHKPIAGTWVNINSNHNFHWMEDGRKHSGSLGRNANTFTNDEGVIEMVAPEGKLKVSVYLADWRASKEIEISREKINEIHIHQKVDEAVKVTGVVLPWNGDQAQVLAAAVHIKAIDGESGDEFQITADESGQFQFETTATQLGAIAYSADRRFAGTIVINELAETAQLQLYPTKEYAGKITDQEGMPVANHKVWASIRVEDKRRFGTSYPTTFNVPRIEQLTDSDGKYQLAGLPCKTKILLGTDTLNKERNRFRSIDEAYFLPDDKLRNQVTKLGKEAATVPKSLAQRYEAMQRDCRLGHFHLMVLVRDKSNKVPMDFISKHMLNYAKQKSVSNYMQLVVDVAELTAEENRTFVDKFDWPVVSSGVFACAFDNAEQELGRIQLAPEDPDAASAAHQFIEEHVPTQEDAQVKWKNAFQLAKKQNKRVWIRTGQRYCGPCFKLSRWMDDHRDVLTKDFILVKIDDVRDLNGRLIANRLTGDRSVGVPFHAIFAPDETMVTDSYGSIGNIGFMSGLEGKRHFQKMMETACSEISPAEISTLLESLED